MPSEVPASFFIFAELSLYEIFGRPSVTVKNRIRQVRVSRGLSQKELADRAGVSQARLNYAEHPSTSPRIDNLLKIARALDTTIDDLVVAV